MILGSIKILGPEEMFVKWVEDYEERYEKLKS
jgi:hypothetical protein